MLSGERLTAEQQQRQQQQGQPPPPLAPPPQQPLPPPAPPGHQAPAAAASSCGLGSLLSAGCRGRAEAFARRLSRRLQTLGMGGGAGAASADEERPFWAAPPTQPVTQPVQAQLQLARVPSDGDVFYDPVDSPGEAATANALHTCSSDSDSSDAVFFDPESSASNCSSASAADDDVFAAYNGSAGAGSGSDSGSTSTTTSTSDTGTLSGLSSSSSSAVRVALPGRASASDDSRSTRTPSEETRSTPRSQSASDDSRPLSELSALEPTPSSYSTVEEDSVATAEFSALEDGLPSPPPPSDRLAGMPQGQDDDEEEETLSDAVSRMSLGLSNGEASGKGEGCDCVVRLHSGRCVLHHSGPRPASGLPNGVAVGAPQRQANDCERAFVTVDLQMNCQVDIDAGAAADGAATADEDGISDEKSAQNLSREVAVEHPEGRGEVANGDASEQVECLIVVSPHLEEEEEAHREAAVANGSASASNDDEDDESRPQRVRRCSSLKTGKTPPGTPGRKKIVRFADVLGLDLADVRTFLDEIPRVPSSAYDDLCDADVGGMGGADAAHGLPPPATAPADCQQQAFAFPAPRTLVPLFQQPWTQPDFLDRVRDRQVCLESATLQDPALLSLAGVVRVRNLDFHKSVHVRYTTDGWRSWADAAARYVPGSCDGFSDRFSFTIYADALPAGGRLELAVRFQCRGTQFWDSNGGHNYAFQCVAAAAPALEPLSPVDDRWPSFY